MAKQSQAYVALRCRDCRETSLEGAVFWRDPSTPTGYCYACVDCMKEHRKNPCSAREVNALGMSFAEIAQEMGLTAERVRQIEASALRKLRNNSFVMSAIRKLLEGRS